MAAAEEHQHGVGPDGFDWNEAYSGGADDYEAPDPDLLEIIDGLKPGRALDLGCGAGGLLLAMAERGWELTGIDIANTAITAAGKVLSARGFSAELCVADATTWKPEADYQLITSSFALPGIARRASIFSMIRGALAPGGVVALKEFDSTMELVGFFSGTDLVTVEELTAAFVGLEILRAEIVDTAAHDHDASGSHAGERWSAALLHARRS